MAKIFPVKVVWRNTDGKTRTRGFDLIPRAEKLQAALNSEGLSAAIYVQDALWSGDPNAGQKTYSQSDEIPY